MRCGFSMGYLDERWQNSMKSRYNESKVLSMPPPQAGKVSDCFNRQSSSWGGNRFPSRRRARGRGRERPLGAHENRTAPRLFSGRLKRRCSDRDTVTEAVLRPSQRWLPWPIEAASMSTSPCVSLCREDVARTRSQGLNAPVGPLWLDWRRRCCRRVQRPWRADCQKGSPLCSISGVMGYEIIGVRNGRKCRSEEFA
jgi:hypothetical protein